jgi:hypothetical protein
LNAAASILGMRSEELLGAEDGSITIEPADVVRLEDRRVGRRVSRAVLLVERG